MVSGYVKCPRCHALLPGSGQFRRNIDPGGTALEERSFPFVPVALGAIAVALVVFFVLGRGDDRKKAPSEPPAEDPAALPVEPAPAAAPGAARPARTLDIPPAAPAGPDPRAVAAELERALGRQRLWSSVQASGDRVEVRSGSCGDPAMGPLIDAAQAALRDAGLTRLRCLAQSGAVVFERDL